MTYFDTFRLMVMIVGGLAAVLLVAGRITRDPLLLKVAVIPTVMAVFGALVLLLGMGGC